MQEAMLWLRTFIEWDRSGRMTMVKGKDTLCCYGNVVHVSHLCSSHLSQFHYFVERRNKCSDWKNKEKSLFPPILVKSSFSSVFYVPSFILKLYGLSLGI